MRELLSVAAGLLLALSAFGAAPAPQAPDVDAVLNHLDELYR